MNSAGGPGANSRPCRSCGEQLYDLLYPRTGKSAPIEARVSPGGNVRADLEAGTYQILTGAALVAARLDGSELRLNHYVSCPSAASWHARSAAKGAGG